MATPIPCDFEGCDQLADILISDIANGGGYGWCGPHYLAVARAMIEAADGAAAKAEADQADADAVARIEALGDPADPTGSDASSDVDDPPGGEPGTPVDELLAELDPEDERPSERAMREAAEVRAAQAATGTRGRR